MKRKLSEHQQQSLDGLRQLLKDEGLPDGTGHTHGVPLTAFTHTELRGLIEYSQRKRNQETLRQYKEASQRITAS